LLTKVLLFSVGTSAEPIIKTIEDQLGNEAPENLKVILIYGRQIGEQKPSPFDIVAQVKEHFSSLPLSFYCSELAQPENIKLAVKNFEEIILNECLSQEPKELVVDFTGGTKVMSAALFYAAIMNATNTNLIFSYVGGKRTGTNGRVTTPINKYNAEVVYQHQYKKIYEQLKIHNYPQALTLAKQLTGSPTNTFIKNAVAIFANYDSLRYKEAKNLLGHLAKMELAAEPTFFLLQQLTNNIKKLRELLQRVIPVYISLKKTSNQQAEIQKKELGNASELVADYFCNAQRRIAQGLYDEAILRIYRALETATQIALLRLSVNPWKPAWHSLNNTVLEIYKEKLSKPPSSVASKNLEQTVEVNKEKQKPLPDKLSFYNSLVLIDLLYSEKIMPLIESKIKNISYLRNLSYLEHGYDSRSKEDAERCFKDGLESATIILGEDISSFLKNQISWD